MVKNLPTKQETQVGSLGREDHLEEEVATHSSVLAWRIPWRGAWQALVYGVAKSQTRLSYQCFHFSFSKPPPLLRLNMCVLHDPGRRVRKGREGKAGFLSFTEHLLGTQNKVFYFYYFIYFILFLNFKIHKNLVKYYYPIFQQRKPDLIEIGNWLRPWFLSTTFGIQTTSAQFQV